MAQQPVPYPAALAELSPEWFSLALSEKYPGTEVIESRVTSAISGTATKVRFELVYEPSSPALAQLPASLWLKGGFEAHASSIGTSFVNEVNFFRDLAPVVPVNRPAAYYAALDPDSSNGIVLLEDLLARGATFGHVTNPLDVAAAAEVLDQLARLHACFWKKAALRTFPWLSSGGAIVNDGVVDQFVGLWEQTERLPRFAFVKSAQRDRRRVREALLQMWSNAELASHCLIHGDSHPGNLFFEPSGRPGYLDWQQVMRGAWAHDVAGFLIPALPVEIRRRHERELMAHYLDRLGCHGAGDVPSFAEAWDAYRRHAMWTFMWVLCPVAYQPENICTIVAERACAAIDDLETLSALAH